MIDVEDVRKAVEDAEAIGDEFGLDGGEELLRHSGVEPESIMAYAAYRVNQLTSDPTARFIGSTFTPDQQEFATHVALFIDGLLIGLQLGRMETPDD